MSKKERKLIIRTERHKSKSEIRKSNNSDWLDRWVDKLNDEMDETQETILYAKKSKIRKSKRKK